MIAFCNRCGDKLTAEPAIVVSPPSEIALGRTAHTQFTWTKYQLCEQCWKQLNEWLVMPKGNVDTMMAVCAKLVVLDGHISLHESFAKEWEPIAALARKAITYKGGGVKRP